MLSADEIRRIAREMELAAGVVEKDYALVWLLKGIYSENSKLRNAMIFKGGTAIRKVFFPEIWRLSEDLDFTVVENRVDVKSELQQVFDFTRAEGGMTYTFQSFHTTKWSIISNVQYVGPLNSRNRIRHDISLSEKLVLEPVWREFSTTRYPDLEEFKVKVYSLKEILIEKIRSIIQRGKSRDYYDVWKLLKENKFDEKEVKELLVEKCEINGIKYEPRLIFDEERLAEAKTFWERGLAHLTRDLPEFEVVISQLRNSLDFLKE